jgi:hypothetical protein
MACLCRGVCGEGPRDLVNSRTCALLKLIWTAAVCLCRQFTSACADTLHHLPRHAVLCCAVLQRLLCSTRALV